MRFTFELTIEEINIILEALGNMSFVRVFAIVNNLQVQFQAQQKREIEESPF